MKLLILLAASVSLCTTACTPAPKASELAAKANIQNAADRAPASAKVYSYDKD